MEFTKEQKQELKKQIQKEIYLRSFIDFFKDAVRVLEPSTQWSFNFHHEYIAQVLQMELERIMKGIEKEKDIIINVPFRATKSLMVSVVFPAWCLVKDPSIPIINISATQELATKFSHKAKMLIDSNWFQEYFRDIFQLRQDSKAKSNFITDKGGSITAFGISSTIIGSGGSIILIDDPSSPNEISQNALTQVISTYLDIIYSRLNNPSVGLRLIMQQRINVRDLSGYLLSTQPEKYHHICIPARLTEDLNPKELAEYYVDGLFWPDRFSEKVMEDFKKTLRPQAYASQLMMRPTLIEGNLIKREWFKTSKLSDVQTYNINWNLIVDTAYTSQTKNDPSALMICGTHNNILYIRKVQQKWLQFYELLELIKEQQKIYNIRNVYIESKASGLSIQQELKRQTNINVLPLQPLGDKVARVTSIQPELQAGRVILVEDDSNEIFLTEVASFPAGHDDITDCLCYGVDQFLKKSGGTIFKVK